MNLLFIGDVVGTAGCAFLRERLPAAKRFYRADAVVANGENSAAGNGLTPQSAEHLFASGVTLLTSGNHIWRRKEILDMLESRDDLLRPANYPGAPGRGVGEIDMGRCRLAVINLMGTAFLAALDNPFSVVERLLERIDTPLILLDFHAEATAEKLAMAYHLDGRVSAVIGTHTHVQTADEQILPGGTAVICDAGMTGPIHSVLGVKPELAIQSMKTLRPVRFENADGPCKMEGVFLTLDDRTGRCEKIERFQIR